VSVLDDLLEANAVYTALGLGFVSLGREPTFAKARESDRVGESVQNTLAINESSE